MAPDEVSRVLSGVADTLFAVIADGSGAPMRSVLIPVIEGIRYIASNSVQLRSDAAASQAALGVTIQSLRSYQQLLTAVSKKTSDIQSTVDESIADLQRVIEQLENR